MAISLPDIYQALFGKNHIQDGSVIDLAEHGRVGGVSTGQGFKFSQTPDYATKVTTVGSVTYVGIAPIGSSQASAVWQAKKVDSTTGVVITYADSGNFSQVATDLTALSYA